MQIITNPTSRKGKSEKLTRIITQALDEKGIAYTLKFTTKALEATAIARKAADAGEDMVLCIGGDGTISEVAGGLTNSNTALGIIPAGTGDDFARFLGIPKDPRAALEVAISGKAMQFDAGLANGRVFINSAGSGFDVDVLNRTLFYKKIFHGLIAYIVGVFASVFTFRGMEITLTHNSKSISTKALLVCVANGRYFGGGMCVAPNADATDGLFDVLYVDSIPNIRVPFLLAAFIKGKHMEWPIVHAFRCSELTVSTSDGSLQLDGEIYKQSHVLYRIMPKAVKIIVPTSFS